MNSRTKEMISYLVFGVLTTVVNIVLYILLTKGFSVDYRWATTFAWIISVLFAFVTNKLYVFKSKTLTTSIIFRELLSFFFFRGLSYVLDLAIMIICVSWLSVDDIIAKILANIVVILVNYIASKYFIFKNKEERAVE
ncbi:GtrA family protein [Priestia filamentosa]|uniref:GtrA family protein n=1 Tax=Priestia filamentosa TaxID=1402861 RepID=UPI000A082A22|nr:GtrA family protein [Priestia filamentosa]MDT3765065.1 GtrA family protein [Priestia filamentosa]OXS66774.1 teichoic acid glycosylation protein [Priestia filamentosa]WRU95365.1 GtrA family protein [Priestia filamentosa]SMF57517.1 Putative flippase GtrA (transmembrane translocase of bactoprenol-linked glucose) [Priestia filamentosa]